MLELETGSMHWSYEDGCITQSFEGAVLRKLSPINTLALCNLLYSNYQEITEKAREEQRKQEKSKVRRESIL